MCPAPVPRSRIGGASCDASTTGTVANNRSTENDSGTHTKRTLKRCTKEDDAASGTRTPSNVISHIELDKSQSILDQPRTIHRIASTTSLETIRFLRTVRRHLGASETACPVPHKTTYQQAAKSHTESPTKSPQTKHGRRRRHESGSLVELPAHQNITTKKSSKAPKGPETTDISSQGSQIDASKGYALDDLNMQIRCYERHITTWDIPDHAFFIFPAQLLITCISKRDFNPLVVPDVHIIDLVCTTVAMGGPHNLHRPLSFSTFYDGAKINYANNEPKCQLTRGIHVEGSSSMSWSSTMTGDGHFGWYMRFWIPVPFVLFQRAETRSFKINVRVHVNGAEDRRGYLAASGDFTLTRLLRGLAM